MKNLHLIPTPKKSRLFKSTLTNNLGFESIDIIRINRLVNQIIYITSDEEIKEGDWCLYSSKTSSKKIVVKCLRTGRTSYWNKNCKKIILATDQDLIKDGVQAIDDEFLEWFVKNSSCEEVIVTNLYGDYNPIEYFYEIIIPIEESNYNGKLEIEWISNNQQCKQIESCYNSLSKKCICPKEPKQDDLHCFENIDFGFGVKEYYTQTIYEEKDNMYSEDSAYEIQERPQLLRALETMVANT